MLEHFFQCPYCWEDISVLLDPSIKDQKYIEDCEICCNPIEITASFDRGALTAFTVNSIEQ